MIIFKRIINLTKILCIFKYDYIIQYCIYEKFIIIKIKNYITIFVLINHFYKKK